MGFSSLQSYLIPAVLLGFFLFRGVKFYLVRKGLSSLIEQGGVIVDVRSPQEFAAASAKNSMNLPLDTLEKSLERLDPEKPVILCCASGTRSGMAASILKRKGFRKVVNAGPWRNVVR